MSLTKAQIAAFQAEVWDYYAQHARQMPWREHTDPYWIIVSEVMLQQTQVDRVRPKFAQFIEKFPTVGDLAAASLSDVLAVWVGLGYNRRAKFLHLAAKEVVERYNGRIPSSQKELVTLPGIGPNTAGAVMAYAFNRPVVFIETNIRSVLIHHFFTKTALATDAQLCEIASQVQDVVRPREWYWALMDYGAHIKKAYGNNVARAAAYRKQSAFQGSLRQIRGQVIAILSESPQTLDRLAKIINDERLPQVITHLQAEKLISVSANRVQLAE